MFRSMTAYGRAAQVSDSREITVELKSVNSKFLDLTVKAPRTLSPLEARIKSAITAHPISRGRVDVFINYANSSSSGNTLALDSAYAEGYLAALYELRDRFGLKDDISVMTVAQNRDIFTVREVGEDLDAIWEELLPVIDEACREFVEERVREGENLRRDILAKISHLRELVDRIEEISKGEIEAARDRITQRLVTILADNRITVDENRILTECAIWADKIAIDEELVRLRSHFSALEAMAELDTPVGRKFDFQLQESGREINTIGSKCQNAEIAKLVVEMKNESEKIREQIQNIE
ncbi:MAG: YicC family protein [Clostridia bacterium]|nr:YicC family protein [Clostridia bacterium]